MTMQFDDAIVALLILHSSPGKVEKPHRLPKGLNCRVQAAEMTRPVPA